MIRSDESSIKDRRRASDGLWTTGRLGDPRGSTPDRPGRGSQALNPLPTVPALDSTLALENFIWIRRMNSECRRTSPPASASNSDPATALENLRAELVDAMRSRLAPFANTQVIAQVETVGRLRAERAWLASPELNPKRNSELRASARGTGL
jgi:hypothetical protein